MTKRWFTASAAALLLLLYAPGASAQAVKGGLLGNITDPVGPRAAGRHRDDHRDQHQHQLQHDHERERATTRFPSLKDGTYRSRRS